MSAAALPWFDDEPRDFGRWTLAAAIVVGIHAALISGYVMWHEPEQIGDDTSAVTVDLEPIDSTPDAVRQDVAPAPQDMIEQQPLPDMPKQPDQTNFEAPPPTDTTIDDLAPPQEQPPEQLEQQPPPAPQTAAPVRGGAPRITPSWQAGLVRHLQRYKRYPGEAQSRGEEGVVLLAFSVDRNGHLLSRRILRSSGHPDLDEEVMAMIERAQPLPPFPPTMPEQKLDLTVPIRFSLR